MLCFLILKTIFYILKFIVRANNVKQFITKNKIAKFAITKFAITKFAIIKFVIIKFVATKFIVAKYTTQKSFIIIVRLLNNFYNNIIFNTKNLSCN